MKLDRVLLNVLIMAPVLVVVTAMSVGECKGAKKNCHAALSRF